MNKNEVIEILRFINGAYGRFVINDNTPTVWHEMLKDQDFDKTVVVLKNHISESKYEPAISDLIQKKDKTKEKVVDLYFGPNSRENTD